MNIDGLVVATLIFACVFFIIIYSYDRDTWNNGIFY